MKKVQTITAFMIVNECGYPTRFWDRERLFSEAMPIFFDKRLADDALSYYSRKTKIGDLSRVVEVKVKPQ